MQKCEQNILGLFSRSPEASFSTSDIAQSVFPVEFSKISLQLSSTDKHVVRLAKRKKAQLHRRLLYYLQKLLDKRVLRVSSVVRHGEKRYCLAFSAGEMVISDNSHTVAIAKKTQFDSFIDSWVDRGMVFVSTSVLHKVDAYAIDVSCYDSAADLASDCARILPHVADALALVSFDSLVRKDLQLASDLIESLSSQCDDLGVLLSVHMFVAGFSLADVSSFFHCAAQLPSVRVVLGVSPLVLHQQALSFDQVLSVFSDANGVLHVQQIEDDLRVFFSGSCGSYVVSPFVGRKGIVVCPVSFAIDLPIGARPSVFRAAARDIAKTCLSRLLLQRSMASSILRGLSLTGDVYDQLSSVTCYLRLLSDSHVSPSLISSVQRELAYFCSVQKNIFSSCCMDFSCSFVVADAFSSFPGVIVSPSSQSKDASRVFSLLEEQDSLRRLFVCSQTDFSCTQPKTGSSIISDIVSLLRISAHPFIAYDFRSLQKTVPLTQFLSS